MLSQRKWKYEVFFVAPCSTGHTKCQKVRRLREIMIMIMVSATMLATQVLKMMIAILFYQTAAPRERIK
jgi:hypothetical protein